MTPVHAPLFKFEFFALGCPSEVHLICSSDAEAARHFQIIRAEIERIESKFSRYRPDSEISKINATAGTGASIAVDPETAALLDFAFTAYKDSNGYFDISTGVLRRVWDFNSGKVPTKEQIVELLPLVGLDKVTWQSPEIELPLKGMELDFGGIGKEFCVDRAVAVGVESGVSGVLVNLGGDIGVAGQAPDRISWKVGVKVPGKRDRALATVAVTRGSVATSGDYEREITIDGTRYSHLLDPKTGWPVQGFQSVTVVAQSALVAGYFSTSAMFSDRQPSLDILAGSNLPYLAIDRTGEIYSAPKELWRVGGF